MNANAAVTIWMTRRARRLMNKLSDRARGKLQGQIFRLITFYDEALAEDPELPDPRHLIEAGKHIFALVRSSTKNAASIWVVASEREDPPETRRRRGEGLRRPLRRQQPNTTGELRRRPRPAPLARLDIYWDGRVLGGFEIATKRIILATNVILETAQDLAAWAQRQAKKAFDFGAFVHDVQYRLTAWTLERLNSGSTLSRLDVGVAGLYARSNLEPQTIRAAFRPLTQSSSAPDSAAPVRAVEGAMSKGVAAVVQSVIACSNFESLWRSHIKRFLGGAENAFPQGERAFGARANSYNFGSREPWSSLAGGPPRWAAITG